MLRVLLPLVGAFVLAVPPMVAAPAKATPIYPGSVFVGFGEPANDLKKVTVGGDVLHAGDYYLPKDATLYDLLMRVGPSSGHAEFSPPYDVVLAVVGADGKPQLQKHRIFGVAAEVLKKIPLAPEVRCYFPLRVL